MSQRARRPHGGVGSSERQRYHVPPRVTTSQCVPLGRCIRSSRHAPRSRSYTGAPSISFVVSRYVPSAIDEPAPRTSTAHGGPSSVESSLAADEDELLRRKDVRRGMMAAAPGRRHSVHSAQIHTAGHVRERAPSSRHVLASR